MEFKNLQQSMRAGAAVGLALMPALLLAGLAGPTSAAGPPDDPPPAATRSLVVEPKEVTLHGRWDTGQLLISATDRDGVVHDLTESAAIEAEDPDVVAVGLRGELTPRANGRTSLVARAAGEERRIPLTVDLCGILPAPGEARAFLDDSRPDKRARLIDALLERPEYAEFWALKWADVLGNNRRNVQPKGTYLFQQWLRDHVARNTPLDTVFRDLIAAEGSTFVNPPTNYFRNDRVSKELELLAQNTTQLFLGVRMSCARCHNHPFEAWTQDDYYGFAAFFARVDSRVDPLNPRIARFNQGALVIEDAGSGETIHPRTGAAVPPKFLGGPVPEIPAGGNRRTVLAGWLTASDNPYFARQLANRVWYHLLGRGIVDPVDDVRDSNPPASEELLQALADDLVRHRFDLKHLVRTIANSRTYQLSADAEGDADAEKYFARAIIRLHGAEPLLDAISAATDVPESFKGMPEGTRAVQLPDGDVYQHPFLSTFGQPARETACECERGGGNDAGLVHALELINGTSVKSKLSGPQNRIGRLLEAGRTDAEVLEELYLATLSRRPTGSEARSGLHYVASTADRRQAWEDVQWALLSTKEFLYRH